MDRIRPDRCGKVFDNWKEEMKTKGPPRARNRYPGMYPSKGSSLEKAKRRAPMAMHTLPIIPLTRGPYVSRIVPTGRAQTLVATAAMVNIRFNLGFKLVSLIAATHVLTEQRHIPDLLSIARGILGILARGTLVPIDSLLDQD